jgi:hypothetical protein
MLKNCVYFRIKCKILYLLLYNEGTLGKEEFSNRLLEALTFSMKQSSIEALQFVYALHPLFL